MPETEPKPDNSAPRRGRKKGESFFWSIDGKPIGEYTITGFNEDTGQVQFVDENGTPQEVNQGALHEGTQSQLAEQWAEQTLGDPTVAAAQRVGELEALTSGESEVSAPAPDTEAPQSEADRIATELFDINDQMTELTKGLSLDEKTALYRFATAAEYQFNDALGKLSDAAKLNGRHFKYRDLFQKATDLHHRQAEAES